ncbi:TIGR03087 family PEP-CTERM/XrtA system glycosyltransferase [Neptunicella sp. SCSIO 80796]|uniref:TIGR03087 family PEP-CTERM/XrtA system glycosyltransferase n=1 Tax=Neptunicella plasticusilytica TaxID=3117012 RepID=UPI003A4E13D8
MSRPPLLYLCHRIPYPPNKGDKIRSFNILQQLAKHYDVHLGCFIDDPYDQQYLEQLNTWCKSVFALTVNKRWSTIKSSTALLTGQALSLPYYHRKAMQSWVDQCCQTFAINHALIFSSTMAQYVSDKDNLHIVVDFVDVDSDKWRQYAQDANPIKKWVYQREWRTLQKFENNVAKHVAHALFVSPQEAELFRQQLTPTIHHKVGYLLNGVDTQFFDPANANIEPLNDNIDVAFTGAMDYWANVDAAVWFVDNVWPSVRQRYPQATFYIVGGNPTAQIKALHGKQGIIVTGRVKDVRPYVIKAKINVAPLQIARGIQNKVLEAMALGRPVIATNMAIEGIEAKNEHIQIVDQADEFARQVCHYLDKPQYAPDSRQWIVDHLQWHETLADLTTLIDVK